MNTHKQDLDFALTDSGNAERLIDEYGKDFQYCNAMGGWLHWNGVRWRVENSAIRRAAKRIGKAWQREAVEEDDRQIKDRLWKWGNFTLSKPGIERMISLASHDRRVIVRAEFFDSKPYLLNCSNGVVDLRTGELMNHSRQFFITKLAPFAYNPAVRFEKWEEFLRRVIPSGETREFLQMATGYSATGDVSERCMFILYGTGANGKSTFVETVKAALGDYAHRTPTETLMQKNSGGGPTPDVANLKGKRFVSASESEDGQRLAESLIKDLTGGDTINARHLHKEPMEFLPSHKIWLSTNHRPNIRGMDRGIWDRIRLIPFTVSIPEGEQNKQLPKDLENELSGVLNWIVRGALMWGIDGLDTPREVRDATAGYKDDMDRMQQFVSDECIVGTQYTVTIAELYKEYRQWCEEGGERAEKQRTFGQRLKEKYGDAVFQDRRDGGNRDRIWKGIGLLRDVRDVRDVDFGFSPREEVIGVKR
jgi:putative DNA primase/helicase